jgi:putative FmdB family regulatory protein
MPFYDLRCPACDKEYNIYASMAEKTEKRIPCPECGELNLETVYKTGPAFIRGIKDFSCPNRHICGAGCQHG